MFTAHADPPLATKLHAPPLPAQLVRRPQLVERLRRAVTRPLTLIAAPAGFGKTTLLSTWLAQASLQAAWISLEPDDDDPGRFWSYVFTAVARLQPGSGAAALSLLQAATLAPRPPIESVLSVWINALAALPDAPALALVLDDYHLITAQPIHHALHYLVDHLPPQLHLVIATRADPPLPLARLRARGQLSEIRAADLRFNVDEVAAFLAQALGSNLDAEHIVALAARTEGWIAGLQLAALALRGPLSRPGRPDLAAFVEAFSGSHRYVIDYLVEEVLARQPEAVQTFLLQTAILERLEGSLCDALLSEPGGDPRGAGSGQAMLEQLERANLFVTPLDDERHWYRYHQLFAEALRHRLQRGQPARVPALHQRASAWYEQHGLPRDAVHHALAAADFEQAARLMEQAAGALVRQGEIATLQRWVDAVPEELIRSRVEIAVWQGWLLFVSGKYDAAERHLQDLERTFAITRAAAEHAYPARAQGPSAPQPVVPGAFDAREIFGRVTAIRASLAIIRRDLPATIALARQALEFLPPDNASRAYVAWYLGKALWLGGDLDAARGALAAAVRVSWEVDRRYAAFLAAHDLAQLQMSLGQLQQADQTYRQALRQAQARGGRQPALGPAYVGRGQLEREWNHLDAATALFQDGLQLCQQTGNTQVILEAYVGLSFTQQARAEAAGASALMQQALQLAERQPLPQTSRAHLEACQAWLALRQGDSAAAVVWAQRSGLSLDQPLSHVREREVLTLVRVLLGQGQPDEARPWLAKCLALAEAQGRVGSVIEILMLQAEAYQASGDLQPASQRLARALALAEPQGYVRLFVDEGAPLAQLLGQLSAAAGNGPPGRSGYREHLLALLLGAPAGARHPAAPLTGPGAAPLAEPLSDREREVLRLIVAGCSNQEIADRLVLALSTVKWYINVLYGKLQVSSRTKAIARARELNIA